MPKTAFEDNATSRTQTFKWYSCFKSGWTLFEGLEPSDDPSSRQTDESLEKMHKIIHEDRRHTINTICNIPGLCIWYTLSDKNPSAWNSLSPEPEVMCSTVAIIIWVPLLLFYCAKQTSLFTCSTWLLVWLQGHLPFSLTHHMPLSPHPSCLRQAAIAVQSVTVPSYARVFPCFTARSPEKCASHISFAVY